MHDDLFRAIKFNCDVSDARFWGYFSICGLLMRYRDLYRSELGLDPWSPIPREGISHWIQQKESRWPELENCSLRDLPLDRGSSDPFDCAGVNDQIEREGLVYGAGYGTYLKPTFFVARLRSRSEIDGLRVYTTEREVVRDLFTSPAMLLGSTIFLRREPLQAMLWDRCTQIPPGGRSTLAEAFSSFGVRRDLPCDSTLLRNLDSLTDACAVIMLDHEVAESRDSVPEWKQLIADAGDRRAELYLRAVQDLLADTSERGPFKRIIEERNAESLALFVGLQEGFRRMLFPELPGAYAAFVADRDWAALDAVRSSGRSRFERVRRSVLDLRAAEDRTAFPARLHDLMQEQCCAPPGGSGL